jgi:hypothetical protein
MDLPRRHRVLPTVLMLAAAPAMADVPAAAAGLSIGGMIYHDLNNDGVHQAGEPEVAGIRVRHGGSGASTVTDTGGRYRLTGLPASGSLLLETGWLRSQCPQPGQAEWLNCPAGPGVDNDFTVVNQFLRYPLTGASSSDAVDAGLLTRTRRSAPPTPIRRYVRPGCTTSAANPTRSTRSVTMSTPRWAALVASTCRCATSRSTRTRAVSCGCGRGWSTPAPPRSTRHRRERWCGYGCPRAPA